jgi:endonuclease-3
MADDRAEKILRILRSAFTLPKWTNSNRKPFQTLVKTIISQNTADRNTVRAFENLSKRFHVTPEALAKAEASKIEESLKVAGLYRNKANKIKQASEIILEEFGGDLKSILAMPLKEARKTLMRLPGVGPKTADVVLLFCAEKPTIPVDTHVNRVSKRLALAPVNGDYETVRESLQTLYIPKDYLKVHVLMILLGRKYCKARNPLCKVCPLNMLCPSKYVYDKNG